MPRVAIVFAALLLVSVVSCDQSDPPEPTASNQEQVDRPSPPDEQMHTDPPFTFDVRAETSATDFSWSVTTPTGGWEMKFAGARSDPRAGHAIIQVVLIRPAPDEIVTQALVTHTDNYRHGRVAFESADLVVKLITRGESEDDAEYRVAAQWQAG